jgi:hypothetical protein
MGLAGSGAAPSRDIAAQCPAGQWISTRLR